QATRRLAEGDLDQRVEPGGPREIQELDSSFNEMAEQLQQAQIRLEAERASLALTIESLGDALVVTDEQGIVTAANPRAAELVPGLTPGADAYAGGSPLPEPELGLAGDVAIEVDGRSLAATAGRLPAARGAGLVWTIRDVSERARLERMKSDFVATASHELRSPLTSIKGFVELLGRSEALGDREREFVDVVLQSTDRLVELVNDLLDVARLEAGRMEIHARLFDLDPVIEEVAVLMGPRVAEKDQQLVLDLPPGLPKVLADPVRVRQVLVNLISNAHQYTEEGGTITVIADGEGQDVALSVADDGQGMAQEDLDHVFDRFVRRDDTGAGTGLGLSIVRSLVDLQGGTIDVQSQVGEGTVFTVRLPAEGLGSQTSHRAVEGSLVLVLTPRADLAGTLMERVEAGGAKAKAPVTVRPGLADLRSQRYDVLLLDLEGLGEDGMELLSRLRDDPELGRRPLVTVCSERQDQALAGEWRVRADVDADELAGTLGAAIVAERSSILVVGRSAVRDRVEAELLATGLDHQWATTGTAAAQACRGERFEVALVDARMRAFDEVLDALDLRGKRHDKAVIVFTDEDTDQEVDHPSVRAVVPLEEAASAAVEALADAPTASLDQG
ncbi:MAG TPA: ATP-binding protein, partial [Thermoleophilaceae bacterium]|nr:ATP-binding protein [Thermoleophilaceae bacterium]